MTVGVFSRLSSVSYAEAESEKDGKDMYNVTDSFIYYIGGANSTSIIKIPQGFLTDGASVPRIFWNIIPPWGSYGQAAIIHDFMCDYGLIWVDGKLTPITQNQIDNIFSEAMKALNVPSWKRWVMVAAVRAYHFFVKEKFQSMPVAYQ